MEKFEELLESMPKPQILELKHADMLGKAITTAGNKSAISWWWVSIPLYMIAAIVMKHIFMPGSTFRELFHEMFLKNKYQSPVFFIALPIITIIINFQSILKIYFYAGKPKDLSFLKFGFLNILLIIISFLVLIFFFII